MDMSKGKGRGGNKGKETIAPPKKPALKAAGSDLPKGSRPAGRVLADESVAVKQKVAPKKSSAPKKPSK
jgi:hypothetical protein